MAHVKILEFRSFINGSTSATTPVFAAVGVGNTLVFTISSASGTTITSITDNGTGAVNVYTEQKNTIYTPYGVAVHLITALNVRGSPTTITVNLSTSDTCSLNGDEYTAAGSVNNFLGVFDTNIGTAISDSFSTTLNGCTIWSQIFTDAGTVTAGSGYTIRENDASEGSATEDLVQATSGSIAVTWTRAGQTGTAGVVVSAVALGPLATTITVNASLGLDDLKSVRSQPLLSDESVASCRITSLFLSDTIMTLMGLSKNILFDWTTLTTTQSQVDLVTSPVEWIAAVATGVAVDFSGDFSPDFQPVGAFPVDWLNAQLQDNNTPTEVKSGLNQDSNLAIDWKSNLGIALVVGYAVPFEFLIAEQINVTALAETSGAQVDNCALQVERPGALLVNAVPWSEFVVASVQNVTSLVENLVSGRSDVQLPLSMTVLAKIDAFSLFDSLAGSLVNVSVVQESLSGGVVQTSNAALWVELLSAERIDVVLPFSTFGFLNANALSLFDVSTAALVNDCLLVQESSSSVAVSAQTDDASLWVEILSSELINTKLYDEWLGAIVLTRNDPLTVDILSSIRFNEQLWTDSSSIFQLNSTLPISTLKSSAVDVPYLFDDLVASMVNANLVQENQSNVASIAETSKFLIEFLSTEQITSALFVENSGILRFDYGLLLEEVVGERVDQVVLFDSLAAHLIFQLAVLPVDDQSLQLSNWLMSVESLTGQQASQINALPVEGLLSTLVDQNVLVDSSVRSVLNSMVSVDNGGTLLFNYRLPIGDLLPSQVHDRIFNVETTAAQELDAVVNLENCGFLVVNQTTWLEKPFGQQISFVLAVENYFSQKSDFGSFSSEFLLSTQPISLLFADLVSSRNSDISAGVEVRLSQASQLRIFDEFIGNQILNQAHLIEAIVLQKSDSSLLLSVPASNLINLILLDEFSGSIPVVMSGLSLIDVLGTLTSDTKSGVDAGGTFRIDLTTLNEKITSAALRMPPGAEIIATLRNDQDGFVELLTTPQFLLTIDSGDLVEILRSSPVSSKGMIVTGRERVRIVVRRKN